MPRGNFIHFHQTHTENYKIPSRNLDKRGSITKIISRKYRKSIFNIYLIINVTTINIGNTYKFKLNIKYSSKVHDTNISFGNYNFLYVYLDVKRHILEDIKLHDFTTERQDQKSHNIKPRNLKSLKIGTFKMSLCCILRRSSPSLSFDNFNT